MRHKLDLGTILQGAGAALVLASLFVRWYDPGGTAWQVFELVDLLLAVAAVATILVTTARLAAGEPGTPSWVQALSALVLVVVVVQLVNLPPAARGAERATGAWLALAGAAAMALGALVHRAHVSVTVDISERDRRRRVPAVDRRETGTPAPADVVRDERGGEVVADDEPTRRVPRTPAPGTASDDDELGRTQPFRALQDDDERT